MNGDEPVLVLLEQVPGGCQGIGIGIDSDQASLGIKPLQHRTCVTASPEGRIDIDAPGRGEKKRKDFVGEDRRMKLG